MAAPSSRPPGPPFPNVTSGQPILDVRDPATMLYSAAPPVHHFHPSSVSSMDPLRLAATRPFPVPGTFPPLDMLSQLAMMQHGLGSAPVGQATSLAHIQTLQEQSRGTRVRDATVGSAGPSMPLSGSQVTWAAPSAAAPVASGAPAPARSARSGETKGSAMYASRHQAAEQRRRTRINERLDKLREIVPHSERANTAKFLEEVLQYVFTLERRVFEAAGSHPRHGTGWDPASQVDEAVLRDGSAIPIEDPAKAKGNEAKRGAAKGSGKATPSQGGAGDSAQPSAAGLGREAAEGGSTEEGTDSGDSAGQEVAQGVGPKGVGARESEGGVQDGGDGSRRGRDAKRART